MRRSFTLIEMLIVVGIIAVLTALVIPNLVRTRIDSNDAMARSIIQQISVASEAYAFANNGTYPLNLTVLISSRPQYLTEDYCSQPTEMYGYTFICSFNQTSGYSLRATPIVCNVTGSKDIQAQTHLPDTRARLNILNCH